MDLASGHRAAVRQILEPGRVGTRVYNLGTGTGTTVLQLVRAFEAASGRPVPYK
jgi:UDP-glucose 4-epimerase